MSRRECMNVKVEAELVRKAKVVAAAKRVTLTDYVSDLLRAQIERDLASVAAGLIGAAEGQPAQPGQQDQGAAGHTGGQGSESRPHGEGGQADGGRQ